MCETFFTQTTRFQDYYGDLPYMRLFSEVEQIDAFLPAELSLQEFHSFAVKHDVVWMSEGAFITTDFPYGNMNSSFDTSYVRDMLGRYEHYLTASFSGRSFSVFASSRWLATVPSDFLVGLFARSDIPVVHLDSRSRVFRTVRRELPVSEAALAELVTQDTCRELELSALNLNEAHFHALRRASSSLKLTLAFCLPIAATATAFVECLVGIQCPVNVKWDDVNTRILARALPGASHLHELNLDMNGDVAPNISSTIQSLEANTGLVKLRVSTRCNGISFPTLCHSLRSHTTLTSLEVYTRTLDRNAPVFVVADESKTIWLEAIIELLKTNTVLHTIELPWRLTGTTTGIYHQEIVPRLEMNRFRRHFLAIKAAPRELHVKLLCFALPLVSTINLIFEVFRDSIDALLPMLLAHGMKSVLLEAPNNKAELEVEIAELVEASTTKDLLLELLGMVES
jgi:hypothetical protein